jgi:hypothetical protein
VQIAHILKEHSSHLHRTIIIIRDIFQARSWL